ncbi:hypothetical protein M514_24012 [Trichuris suis]|uniref:Uncharacterized protein n=1 Tax=Trichuris suis TaxID=68888 RepID=A0A085N318_9BILA|nr:hypothetical protein M514_26818 [Trichuris suis]KFD63864.1 hypothetical protein M514_24012 [Trichuris suis]
MLSWETWRALVEEAFSSRCSIKSSAKTGARGLPIGAPCFWEKNRPWKWKWLEHCDKSWENGAQPVKHDRLRKTGKTGSIRARLNDALWLNSMSARERLCGAASVFTFYPLSGNKIL